MKNQEYKYSRTGFTSKPVAKSKLDKTRNAATKLIKNDCVSLRSCWLCNGCHDHFLIGKWENWVLRCFECGKFFFNKIDITDYENKI